LNIAQKVFSIVKTISQRFAKGLKVLCNQQIMNSIFQSSFYAAAPLVASKLEAHLTKHLCESFSQADQQSALPDKQIIETIINTAFWTSLQREEGYSPRMSLAYLSPEQAIRAMMFEQPLPLDPRTLTKLSPAIKSSGLYLGIWRDEQNRISLWGTIRTLPQNCFVLEILEPALLVVKQNRDVNSDKLTNILILSGEEIKEIDESAANFSNRPEMLSNILPFGLVNSVEAHINVPIQLAAAMREHGCGGSLLIVPQHSNEWLESVVLPLPYSISPTFTRLTEIIQQSVGVAAQDLSQEFFSELNYAIKAISGLTAVDGATVITDKYELLAFGAKIKRRAKSPQIEQVLISEPVIGNRSEIVRLIEYGGTRHLSAAQFVQDQPDAVALVASQDGRFTVFARSPHEKIVHGYRIEVLLL
jgi:hypothetical protein